MKKIIKFVIVIAIIIAIFVVTFFTIKTYKNKALFTAIDNNDLDGVKIALDKGADINSYRHKFLYKELGTTNPTPLILACKNGNEDIVKFLLDNGADINKKDKFTGKTPLLASFHGAKENRFRLAMYLIDEGADIYIYQPTSSAIYESIYISPNDNEQTIEDGFILFKDLITKNINTRIGPESLLTYAAHYRNLNVVEYLIDNGYYDINSTDENGNTALIVAAEYNRVEIIDFLLKNGADKTIVNLKGKSAYDYANENGYDDIAKILK